jgi:hypothetical protein
VRNTSRQKIRSGKDLFRSTALPFWFLHQFYEKNNKMLPGKKGISLTVDQYNALRAAVEKGAIDKEIAALQK